MSAIDRTATIVLRMEDLEIVNIDLLSREAMLLFPRPSNDCITLRTDLYINAEIILVVHDLNDNELCRSRFVMDAREYCVDLAEVPVRNSKFMVHILFKGVELRRSFIVIR